MKTGLQANVITNQTLNESVFLPNVHPINGGDNFREGTVGHELDLASLVHVQGIHYALESNRNCQIDVSLLQEEEKKIRRAVGTRKSLFFTDIGFGL
ncbi:hypothetical protein ACJX0J_024529, partial [Zea mays]